MRSFSVTAVLVGVVAMTLSLTVLAQDSSLSGIPNATAAPASGGQIWVEVSTTRLVMGKDKGARIQATFPRGAKEVIFFAAHGKVSDVAMLSPTRASARYEAPDGYIPRFEVVVAVATVDGQKRWGYAVIHLYGQGEAEIKTQPGSEAIIYIAGKRFGPAIADDEGKAKIHVEVPPGIQFGYDERDRPIDLHVPKIPRTAVFTTAKHIPIDKRLPVELLGVVVTPNGSLDETSTIEFVADHGNVEDIQPIGGGAFTAKYIPPKDHQGTIRIEAFIGGDESPPSTVDMAIVPPSLWFESFSMEQRAEGEAEGGARTAKFITPTIGFAWYSQSVPAYYQTLDFGGRVHIFGEQFILGLELGFSYGSKNEVVVKEIDREEINFDGKLTTWFLPVSFHLGWSRFVSSRMSLEVFGQAGYSFASNKIEAVSNGATTGKMTTREFGHMALFGLGTAAEWMAGPGAFTVRARYVWQLGSLESFNGVLTGVVTDLGYRFWF
ncbi:MAG: hypothetical protein GY854_23100 [Deltaproteobacteria bacterium]|nr:hypothetical protein [Deltaproteobacteria bacterium]